MKISPATIGAYLCRATGRRALSFHDGPVVRKRDDKIIIRHCAIMTSRCTADERQIALGWYKNLLASEGVEVKDYTTSWGEPALIVETGK
jgi:hypothetical protein